LISGSVELEIYSKQVGDKNVMLAKISIKQSRSVA